MAIDRLLAEGKHTAAGCRELGVAAALSPSRNQFGRGRSQQVGYSMPVRPGVQKGLVRMSRRSQPRSVMRILRSA
jgi:hypothetical protein